MSVKYNTITFELVHDIGHLILDQPPSNKMTIDFFSEFHHLLDGLHSMEHLKAIVISGRGRHFSAGADLDQLLSLVRHESQKNSGGETVDLPSFLEKNYKTFLSLEALNIPVIAAIRGVCLGSGFELALFCHFRFCGEDALFGLPESTYNLIPGIGGTSRISLLSGKSKALELVLHGNTFPAEDALGFHLVDKIFPKKQVVEMAIGFAEKITTSYKKEKAKLYLNKLL
jgi:enoyl-CoA hydratase/carnithine racemase